MEDEDLIDFTKARPASLHSLRLPAFWVDKPVSWFVLAESRFRLHGIHREQTRYDYLVSALTNEAVNLVLDAVEHQLTDYQKIATLHKMEPLGGQKPLERLASMRELCPRGHETSIFFTHLFLERLPAELRITLGEDNHQNVRALAKKADVLWSLHGMKASFLASVASLVDVDEPSSVAAVSSRGSGRGAKSGARSRGNKTSSVGRVACSLAVSKRLTSLKLWPQSCLKSSRIQSGLCVAHFNHGEKAFSCTAPCSWIN
jgi:hypothetical protein